MFGRTFNGAYSLEDLRAGDPWAWGTLGAILLSLLAFGIVWLKLWLKAAREEEARVEAQRREAQERKTRKVSGRALPLHPAQRRREAQGRKTRKGRRTA